MKKTKMPKTKATKKSSIKLTLLQIENLVYQWYVCGAYPDILQDENGGDLEEIIQMRRDHPNNFRINLDKVYLFEVDNGFVGEYYFRDLPEAEIIGINENGTTKEVFYYCEGKFQTLTVAKNGRLNPDRETQFDLVKH